MSSNSHRQRRRGHPKAEQRAEHWRISHLRNALESDPQPGRAPKLGAFTVTRRVRMDTKDGLYERPDILEAGAKHAGVTAMRAFTIALIPPSEGRKNCDPWGEDNDDRIKRLEATADAFPVEVNGFVRAAGIVGARRGKPGRRFIGYYMNMSAQEQLQKEREELVAAAGIHNPIPITPHIALFETRDAEAAENLRVELSVLAQSGIRGIPVQLGRAIVAQPENRPNIDSIR